MASFSQQVARINRKYEARLRAVARESVQETLSIAQRTRGEGGRMRVKTGFLRASLQGAVGQIPSGPTTNEGDKTYPVGSQVAGEPVAVALLKWDPNKGVPFFAGWTANYARFREAKDGFLRGATELWDRTVEKNAAKVRSRLG